MEIESAHTHDFYDGHSTRGIQAIGGRPASKIEMAAYRDTPPERERISDLMNIIPKGLDSVLDAGARDGHLSRLLTERFASVTALDLEKPSIEHDRITCVKGDVRRLELASGSFDVVLCSEVLEHIPGKGLEQACRELSRVAKSHVVIGVPYRQDTRLGRTTCQSCGRGNPPWGHVNVFDERRLTELFLPLRKVGVSFVGSSRSRTNALSSLLMDVAGNPWGTYDQEEVCIHCGQEIGEPAKRNLAQKLCSRLAFSLNAAQARLISARPNWIHIVFQKNYLIESGRRSLERSAAPVRLAPLAAPEQTLKRLLFVAYQFAPSLEMGARSCVQIARYLPLYGWSPVVLTAQEKYIEERYRGSDDEIAALGLPDAIVRTRLLPHLLDFYRWLKSALRRKPEDLSGTGDPPSAVAEDWPPGAKGKLRQLILPSLCTPDIYTGWILPAIVAGLRASRKSKAEQIFSSGPFWTNHLVGLALSYMIGLPWIAHFRDPWFTGAWQSSTTTFADWLNYRLERIVVTRATAVVSVTEEHSAAFRRAYPRLPADKFFTVPNGYDNEEWEKEPTGMRREQKSEGKFLIAYTGKFYIERDPQPLFRALKVLIDSGEIEREKVQVDLVGWCETSEGRSVREMAEEFGLSDCVNILGPRSRPETIRRMKQADLLLLLAERFIIQIPGKTYEYLRAGRPILALTPEGALANFLRRTGAGWVVNQKDDAAILSAVRERHRQWKAGDPGPSADPKIVAGFDRRKLASQLAELFDYLYLNSLKTGLIETKSRESREMTEMTEQTETSLDKALPSFPYSLSIPQDKTHTATARSINGAPNEAKMSVMAIARLAELEWFLPAWEDLAASALEPNVFYEPWMMMPALRNFGSDNTLLIALIFTTDPARPGTPLLCGLFPLECGRGYKGAPVKFLRLWRHKHCFLTTPLIRAGYERQTLETFFDWLTTDARSGALIEFDMLPGEGLFHQTLVDYLYRSGKTNRIFESYTRALFQPAADADTYLCAAMSAKHRKMIRRLERGLSEIGRLEYDSLTPVNAADVWIKEFLQLEASGWKGRESSALASNELERTYFKSIAREAFRRGRLAMMALRLDGRPIAYKCDFLAGCGSFTFKIAFDEDYARFSPGMLLEIENVRRLHAQSQIEWVDSCADPFNFMFNRLWLARRTIQNLTVSTGKAPGDLVVSMTPLLSWINRKLKPGKASGKGLYKVIRRNLTES